MNPCGKMTAEERRSRIVSGLASYAGEFNKKGSPKMNGRCGHT